MATKRTSRGKGGAGGPTHQSGPRNPYIRYHKLVRPELHVATTSLWAYPHQQYGDGKQGDARFKGATPSWVIWQVLNRWTKPNNRILDPFCGSGTTLDVCKDLSREGIGFDLAPTRGDIRRADARHLPMPDASVDHAFFDPPYADNLAYSDDDACIGRLPAEGGRWAEAMSAVIQELARVVRPGGIVAAYLQDTVRSAASQKVRAPDDRGDSFTFHALGLDLAMLARKRLDLIEHIVVVRDNARLDDGREHRKAASGGLIRGFNHLLVFRVPKQPRGAANETPSSAKPSRAKPSRATPSQAKSSQSKPDRPRPASEKSGGAKSGGAKSGGAKSGGAKTGARKPAGAKPGAKKDPRRGSSPGGASWPSNGPGQLRAKGGPAKRDRRRK